jgi:hypothetical protein
MSNFRGHPINSSPSILTDWAEILRKIGYIKVKHNNLYPLIEET